VGRVGGWPLLLLGVILQVAAHSPSPLSPHFDHSPSHQGRGTMRGGGEGGGLPWTGWRAGAGGVGRTNANTPLNECQHTTANHLNNNRSFRNQGSCLNSKRSWRTKVHGIMSEQREIILDNEIMHEQHQMMKDRGVRHHAWNTRDRAGEKCIASWLNNDRSCRKEVHGIMPEQWTTKDHEGQKCMASSANNERS